MEFQEVVGRVELKLDKFKSISDKHETLIDIAISFQNIEYDMITKF